MAVADVISVSADRKSKADYWIARADVLEAKGLMDEALFEYEVAQQQITGWNPIELEKLKSSYRRLLEQVNVRAAAARSLPGPLTPARSLGSFASKTPGSVRMGAALLKTPAGRVRIRNEQVVPKTPTQGC